MTDGYSCLRCGGPMAWLKDDELDPGFYRCEACPARFGPQAQSFILAVEEERGGNRLVWFFDTRECWFGTIERLIRGGGVSLPWLPLDITRERLKLLVTFS